jgi:hypothetical protein
MKKHLPEKINEKEKKDKATGNDTLEGGVSMAPPSQFGIVQKKDDDDKKSGIDKVADAGSTMKDAMDYAEYGDMALEEYDEFTKINDAGKKKGVIDSAKDFGKNVIKKKGGLDGGKGKLGLGKKMGKGGKALDALDLGVSAYKMLEGIAKDETGDTVKHGVETTIKFANLAGGPLGAALSAGYELGTLIDEKSGGAVSDFYYKETGLKGKAKERANAKMWKAERESKQIELSHDLKIKAETLITSIQGLLGTKNLLLENLGTMMAGFEKDQKIPDFEHQMPDIKGMYKQKNIASQIEFVSALVPKLRQYQRKLIQYIKIMTNALNLATKEFRRVKLGSKVVLKKTGNGNERKYIKYNKMGQVKEEGIVKVNKNGKIIGGANITYYQFNKEGNKIGDGSFDFDKRGKKINKKSKGIIIY